MFTVQAVSDIITERVSILRSTDHNGKRKLMTQRSGNEYHNSAWDKAVCPMWNKKRIAVGPAFNFLVLKDERLCGQTHHWVKYYYILI